MPKIAASQYFLSKSSPNAPKLIEFFKSSNDKYGHSLGDTCLQTLAI
ncbi:diguanylate cyclase domain-containing protein [Nostoc sp. CALU 546]